MMLSLTMLAMVERVSKNLVRYDLKASSLSYLHRCRSWWVAGRWMDPWKLSTDSFFKSSPEWIESHFKLSSHVRGADSRAIGK